MSNIYYEIQQDCKDIVYAVMKSPVRTCINNCWFCSRLNNFVNIDNYKAYNKTSIELGVESLKKYHVEFQHKIIFDYGINFTHEFDTSLVDEFKTNINYFIQQTKGMKNVYFRLGVVDDLLLKSSVEVLLKYIQAILPAYKKIPFDKEIKLAFSFDFNSRLSSMDKCKLFLSNYKKMLKFQNSELGLKNNIKSNRLVVILLAKTVRFIVDNWNSDNAVIKTFKDCLEENTDVSFSLPWPMNLSILRDKSGLAFCKNYCYLNIKDLLKMNDLLGIEKCPYLQGKIEEGLFFCELNGGCKNKCYCKQYLLGRDDVYL